MMHAITPTSSSPTFNGVGVKGLVAACALTAVSYSPAIARANNGHIDYDGREYTSDTEIQISGFWQALDVKSISTYTTSRSNPPIGTRITSDHERSIAAIRSWGALDANWDGEGASAPSENAIRVAADFICNLDRKKMAPVEMLHANGRIGLLWDEEDLELYGEIEFISEQRIAYFFQNSEGKHKGELIYSGGRISEIFQALIPDEYAS